MTALLLYAYAVGVSSSRKIERASFIVEAGDRLGWNALAEEPQQALGRGACGELLVVIVAAVVGEVHHALHDHPVQPLLTLTVGEFGDRRGLHLDAERLAHRLRDEGPDLFILDDACA